MLITTRNKGREMVDTNYWDTPMAGLLYATGNAGAWRLLVPPTLEHLLEEMRTGQRATLEASLIPGNTDLVFKDGTEAPFCVALSKHQFDRALKKGTSQLIVYTRHGKQMELPLQIK